MTKNGRPVQDLLWEWISNDHPVCRFSGERVRFQRDKGGDYGAELRDMVTNIRFLPGTYRSLCKDMSVLPEYRDGYPVHEESAKWTMRQISDAEFADVDWTALADDIFPDDNDK
jgi:hypothetical protein